MTIFMEVQMNKTNFLDSAPVADFVGWLAAGTRIEEERLPAGECSAGVQGSPASGSPVASVSSLIFDLNIGQSPFVPTPIACRVVGLENVLRQYCWRSTGMSVGDWAETKFVLSDLAHQLRNAIAHGDDAQALIACRDILAWGGNRDFKVGAWRFLSVQPSVCTYLSSCAASLSLSTASIAALTPPIQLMNSMLTKVHSLFAADGLPIYDSRVAAAIATLVECWRIRVGLNGHPLPTELCFPATLPTRTVLRRYPNARYCPSVMAYGQPKAAAQWSSAKIRLGWIMHEVLTTNPDIFKQEGALPDRMHAFEASLFMIGYDVRCIDPLVSVVAFPTKAREGKQVFVQPTVDWPSAKPLSGSGKNIYFQGSLADGFDVVWGSDRFRLEAEEIENLAAEFAQSTVNLGSKMDGPPEGTLGRWLVDNGWPSARYASAIAPILVTTGVIAKYSGKRPIRLEFA